MRFLAPQQQQQQPQPQPQPQQPEDDMQQTEHAEAQHNAHEQELQQETIQHLNASSTEPFPDECHAQHYAAGCDAPGLHNTSAGTHQPLLEQLLVSAKQRRHGVQTADGATDDSVGDFTTGATTMQLAAGHKRSHSQFSTSLGAGSPSIKRFLVAASTPQSVEPPGTVHHSMSEQQTALSCGPQAGADVSNNHDTSAPEHVKVVGVAAYGVPDIITPAAAQPGLIETGSQPVIASLQGWLNTSEQPASGDMMGKQASQDQTKHSGAVFTPASGRQEPAITTAVFEFPSTSVTQINTGASQQAPAAAAGAGTAQAAKEAGTTTRRPAGAETTASAAAQPVLAAVATAATSPSAPGDVPVLGPGQPTITCGDAHCPPAATAGRATSWQQLSMADIDKSVLSELPYHIQLEVWRAAQPAGPAAQAGSGIQYNTSNKKGSKASGVKGSNTSAGKQQGAISKYFTK